MFHDLEGNIYEGEFLNNKKHGLGKQIFANGDVYEGHWENGLMEGKGKLTMSSGDIYVGLFSKGLKHGKGTLTFKATQDIYDGEWQYDKMTGLGKYIYTQEGKVYEGNFVEGAPCGPGIMTAPAFKYTGSFRCGLFDGFGKIEDYGNQTVYEGRFNDGKR
jgi:hypothetical protein